MKRLLPIAAALLLLGSAVSGAWGRPDTVPGSGAQLSHQAGGLLTSYAFRSTIVRKDLLGHFDFSGSALPGDGYWTSDSSGLGVGVRTNRAGLREGYAAVTHMAYPLGSVFHVHMFREARQIRRADQSGEAVFTVQTGATGTGLINHVLVASSTSAGLTHWVVGYTEGHMADAKTVILWRGMFAPNAALSEDITLRTDGHALLQVYFGKRLVYGSDRLRMHIDQSLQPHLGVQGFGIPYISHFQDFWVTRASSLTQTGLPVGTRVSFQPSGGPSVTAIADRTGRARIELSPIYAFGTGTLTFQAGSRLRRIGPFAYAGGEVDTVLKPRVASSRSGAGGIADTIIYALCALVLILLGGLLYASWRVRTRIRVRVQREGTAHQVTVVATNASGKVLQLERIGLQATLGFLYGNSVGPIVTHPVDVRLSDGDTVSETLMLPQSWIDRRRSFHAFVRLKARPAYYRSAHQHASK